jgi:hypothetical protein
LKAAFSRQLSAISEGMGEPGGLGKEKLRAES